jgi:hypothetical protein
MHKLDTKIAHNTNKTKMFAESKVAIKVNIKKPKIKVQQKLYDIKESILQRMASERFSLTCAPGGENHAGMEIIGRMPIKGEGLTMTDMEGLHPYFQDFGESLILNLNELSEITEINGQGVEHQGRVIILRNWIQSNMEKGAIEAIYCEIAADKWDAEYLDRNKYRTEIIDGIETKVRGKRMNKRARTNLCYVADREQEPAVMQGKGRIVDLKKKAILYKAVEKLKKMIADGLVKIGSKTKVEINVVEGNRYYNLKKTGIGFHGDTERVIVICISIGCDNYPMRWQWFKDGMPIGKSIDIRLNCGDIYIMSEKAVGSDWKLRSIYTLRHAAGANKYINLDRWEKKRPAYEVKLKEKEEKRQQKIAEMFIKETARNAAKVLKNKKLTTNQVKKNDKKNRRKTTKCGSLLK